MSLGNNLGRQRPLTTHPGTHPECRATSIEEAWPGLGICLSLNLLGCGDVHDLTPLDGMKLPDIWFSARSINKGMEVLRQMKSLKAIHINERASLPPEEFWKKYDAGRSSRRPRVSAIGRGWLVAATWDFGASVLLRPPAIGSQSGSLIRHFTRLFKVGENRSGFLRSPGVLKKSYQPQAYHRRLEAVSHLGSDLFVLIAESAHSLASFIVQAR